jgi:16S rRNA processing protein RimM
MPSSSSKTDGPPTPSEAVLVGIVLRPHGVAGAVVVDLQSDVPGRFDPGRELDLVPRTGNPRRVTVVTAAPWRGGLRVRFEGVTSRDEAEQLRGGRLEVARARVPEAPPGSFYQFELYGFRCRDRRAGELGEVVDVLADGGGWLLVVERTGGRRLTMPFAADFVTGVDRAARRIDWDLPEGLIETCESRS